MAVKKAFAWFKVSVRVTSEWNNILDGYDSKYKSNLQEKKKNSSLKASTGSPCNIVLMLN